MRRGTGPPAYCQVPKPISGMRSPVSPSVLYSMGVLPDRKER